MNGFWEKIEEHINSIHQTQYQFTDLDSVSGGCINETFKVSDSNCNKSWFIKKNKASLKDMFEAEARGLREILKSNSLKALPPVCYGSTNDHSYLVLEFIPLSGTIDQAEMGKQLARMHRTTNDVFGWKYNNTIGTTPQPNKESDCWISFWREQRLIYQLELAHKKGYPNNAYEKGLRLADSLAPFFGTYRPIPSLLHGDLWGGNCGSDPKSNPVIYDPAVYYGDRETDIAMTELFGGFTKGFYSSYNNAFPLDAGYKKRKTLYNLYHILNHYNLFGGGYGSQAESMTDKLLSEIG